MHFHRDAGRGPRHEQDVAIDIHLEQAIAAVQEAPDAFLGGPGEQQRQDLQSALEALDQRTAASDAYESSIVGSAVYGFTAKGSVLGETGRNPVAAQIPSSVLQAQIALVKAAKAAVTDPSPATLAALHAASADLGSVQAGVAPIPGPEQP